MKTSELIGPALDWAMAKCEGFEETVVWGKGAVRDTGFVVPINKEKGTYFLAILRSTHDKWCRKCDGYPWGREQVIWQPSTDWSQGGPIIEREKISTEYPRDDLWVASIWMGNSKRPTVRHGPTPLIAAMRCFCASKLGDEVDVPEELK